MYALSDATVAFFSRLECRIKVSLGMRQTDLVVGYFVYWFPTVAIAILILLMLRMFAGAWQMRAFVRRGAGIIIVSTPAVLPIYSYNPIYGEDGWRVGVLMCELILAIALVVRFQSRKWNPPAISWLALLAAHFAVWRFLPTMDWRAHGANVGVILGFFAAAAWSRHVRT